MEKEESTITIQLKEEPHQKLIQAFLSDIA